MRAKSVVGAGLPGADSVWWREGRIQAVGTFADIKAAATVSGGPPATLIELPDCLVTPGFVDGHTHFAEWAVGRQRVNLGGCRTRAEAVARAAKGVVTEGWIQGQGFDPNGWEAPPTREALDQVLPTTPAAFDSHDVHALWVNSAALARCGIDRSTRDPEGGRIVRDAAGEPTGLLLEHAVRLVHRHLPRMSPDHILGAVRAAQSEAHQLGVTGIQNVEGADALTAFQKLEGEAALRLRVLAHLPLDGLDAALRVGLRSGWGSPWLVTGGVKLFLDGALGSQTAWMLEPYEASRDHGIVLTDEPAAREALSAAARGGIAATVHAIGDAAVRRALDLIEMLPRTAIPHRIEHFQLVHPADLARAARAGIIASMQPAHLLTDIPLVDRHWGARGAGAFAFRTLLSAGTPLVFGSDVPVETIDPRDGVYAALDRVSRDGTPAGGWRVSERLSFDEVVHAYSAAPWAAAGRAGAGGTLIPGQVADLVVWSAPAVAARAGDGAAFRAARAVLTVVGGETVWQE
ncbi:MAG TPA: amidohydrolase [Gemmatimonadales bacterium]|nr:amidohydrolase [Gemmatimonadales bacterium]